MILHAAGLLVGKQVEGFCAFRECDQQVPATHRILVQPVLLHKMDAHRYEVWLAPLPCQSGSGLHSWEAPSGGEEEEQEEEETAWKNIATHAAPCVVDDFAFAPPWAC